jgi:hypothetical protein
MAVISVHLSLSLSLSHLVSARKPLDFFFGLGDSESRLPVLIFNLISPQ